MTRASRRIADKVSSILQPRTLDQAADALAKHGSDAKVIAGGTAMERPG